MSYYLGGDLAALEEAVVSDVYFEGLGGAGDWKSPSMGGARARHFAAEQRNWAGRLKGSQGAVGGNVPRIIGGGTGGKVKDDKGKWRDPTAADNQSMKEGTFDPKRTGGGGYTDGGGRRVGSETKEGNAQAALTSSAAWQADQSRQQDQGAAGWNKFAGARSGESKQAQSPQQQQQQRAAQSPTAQRAQWEQAGKGRSDGLPAWQTTNLRGLW